ncbi:Xaa-Pro dipeptidase [Aliikangiella sp. G2MR2-5]|uniref:Xaa-Pro dipeptidase n=1 Tax=Aliikangiella sp. G2MR2-5 TaxID=2788943 RepID=UPI001FEF9131|nr:Xaa-Pro dipeptidase [Aliikangiella sp. G2MR2-5]
MNQLYSNHIGDLLKRHRQLMQNNDIENLIISSGTPIRVYQDDMDYPFKSSFFFRTYVPLTELPHSFIVIGLSGKPKLVYFQPVDFWHTPPADPSGYWTEHFEIEVIKETKAAAELLPLDNQAVAILGEDSEILADYEKAQKNPESLINAIYWQRAYKSDYEIECIKQANQLAARAHNVAEKMFRAGKSEQQIHLAYLESLGILEHQLPYGNIIALNANGAILHYHDCQSKVPDKVRSFLIDAGASVAGYHSDITRTYAYEAGEFAELISAMDAVNLECIGEARVGAEYGDLHASAHRKIARLIHDFNFVDMSVDALVETDITSTFFPHGLGHLIGLQVHDVGGQFADETGAAKPPPAAYPFLRSTRTIESNMVYTVEPGFYFIDPLLAKQKDGEYANAFNWDKIESFRPYGGIRIEDNIVIRESGVENLTRDAFSAL